MDYRIPEIPMEYYRAIAARDGKMPPKRPTEIITTFRVSDVHVYFKKGCIVKDFLKESKYAIDLISSDGKTLHQRRYESCLPIKKGCVLFMGDTVNKTVWRGEVLDDGSEIRRRRVTDKDVDSCLFLKNRGQRTQKKFENFWNKHGVLEKSWKVNWVPEDELTDEWKERLQIGKFCKGVPNTVFPLSL